jgi:Na+/phosphate symporter
MKSKSFAENSGKLIKYEQFKECLNQADERILETYTLTVDGRELSEEEARRFIAFIRAERSI